MSLFSQVRTFLATALQEWQNLDISGLRFSRSADLRLMLVYAIGLLALALIVRAAMRPRAERARVVLPALPPSITRSRGSFLTRLPLLLFLLGVPFFALALGDPYSSLIGRDVTFPGRRVAVLIDASISMLTPFLAQEFANNKAADRFQRQPAFYSAVGAAKRFLELRSKSHFRDLMALIEFGDEAYVVTPFTNDYDNILLSVSLIGDPLEFGNFPDRGTLIGQAIQQSIELFKAFNFLDASGNMMVIFTDGEDAHATVNGVDLDEIMARAVQVKIPVYFIRTNFGRDEGSLVPDELWKPAIAKTGGRFFAAKDEAALIEAIHEIDEASGGNIQVRQYIKQEPRFAIFTAIALACWGLAATLKLAVPFFQRLP